MSESSSKNTLVDAQLWARVGKAVVSRAGSKLLSIPEQRRAKQPDALRAVGRELLDYLVEQARKKHLPFDFIDMSAKKEWEQNEWKKRCRTKINRCDGVIALLSKSTHNARGARW